MTVEVYLGLAGWGYASPGFYPDELPEEWREAYYATQLNCVWLDHAAAGAITPELAERWLADTPEGFRFVFEAGSLVPPALAGRSVVAGGEGLIWFDGALDLAGLSAEIRRQAEIVVSLFVLSRGANSVQIGQVRTLIQLLGL